MRTGVPLRRVATSYESGGSGRVGVCASSHRATHRREFGDVRFETKLGRIAKKAYLELFEAACAPNALFATREPAPDTKRSGVSRRTNRIPVRHARSETRGRSPFGRRCGAGKNGSTRSHNGTGSSTAAIGVHVTWPTRFSFRRFVTRS